MGIFLRKLWQNKPKQWGPPSQVSNVLRDRLEKIGVSWEFIALALPMWNPGDQLDYGPNNIVNVNNQGVFKQDRVSLPGGSGTVVPISVNENAFPWPQGDYTICCNFIMQEDWSGSTVRWVFARNEGGNRNGDIGLLFRSASNDLSFLLQNGASTQLIGSDASTFYIGEKLNVIITKTSNVMQMYVNGVKQAAEIISPINPSALHVDGRDYAFGADNGTSVQAGEKCTCDLLSFFAFDGLALNYNQIQHLSNSPYQLWQRKEPTYFSSPTGLIVSAPTFAPTPGGYPSTQTITISTTTPSATIYYTTDGSDPTTSSPVYSTPISMFNGTLKAFATRFGYTDSSITSGTYSISGAAVGQTLSSTNGTWTNSPTSYSYQWERDGSPISGATSSTYLLVNADSGHNVGCSVTATNAAGDSLPEDSNTFAVTTVI